MPPSNDFIDGFGPIDAGINSGVAPQLLPRNQAAFATNATFRGGFIRNRPALRKINLNFDGDEALEALFTQATFQGASYFVNEPKSRQSICASIGGRLFEITPDTVGGASIEDVTITADANPSDLQIAWLWQSERWLVVQNGQNLPIFYDGVAARRSLGNEEVIAGVTAANFNTPAAIGSTVEVQVTAPWAYGTGITVTNQTETYTVESFRSTGAPYTLTAEQTAGATGTVNPDGMNLVVPSGAVTFVKNVTNFSGGQTFGIAGTNPAVIAPPILPVGSRVKVVSNNGLIELESLGIHPPFGILFVVPAGSPALPSNTTIAVGALIYATDVTWSPVATTTGFTSPGVGNNVSIPITAEFTGAIPSFVYSADGQQEYEVTAQALTGAVQYFVTLELVSGSTGAARNFPQNIAYQAYELPAGRMGVYGRGRNWVCLPDGRSYIASDIVGGSSGTPAYDNRDAVLNVTENEFLYGGGKFIIPGNLGDITAMVFTATLDESLGQGPLQIGTPTSIFSCNAPVDRSTWQDLTNPIQTQSLIGKGPLGQYGTILVNSDTMFRALDGIGSLILARREFDTWGNTPISREVQRIVDEDNETLLQNATAVQFDNRLLMGCFPVQGPWGVYHQGIIALNFDPVSSLRGKAPSIYDGLWTGINAFQFVTGKFGNDDRAFAFCFSKTDNKIELWELLKSADVEQFDNDTQPITWSFETGALFQDVKGKGPFDHCQLRDGELHLADVEGTVFIQAWYRPDYSECWIPWNTFSVCAERVDGDPKQFRSRVGLGVPDSTNCEPTNGRPTNIGMTFQFRFQITGACKVMGGLFRAVPDPEPVFAPVPCDPLCSTVDDAEPCEPCKETGDCLQFDLVFYNLNAHKKYSNQLLMLNAECPDGTVRAVTVPAGIINFTLPFPPDFSGPYPPLFLACPSGGTIVATLENGATQEQIDAVVQGMIAECAQAYADANVNCNAPAPPETCDPPTSFPTFAAPGTSERMIYVPATETLWASDPGTSTIVVYDVRSQALVHAIDISTFGAQTVHMVYDSVNEQVVAYVTPFLLFIDVGTYAVTDLNVAAWGGQTFYPLAVDTTRGNILFVNTTFGVGGGQLRLFSGASKSQIADDDFAAGVFLTSPSYVATEDVFYLSKEDSTFWSVNPTTLALTDLNVPLPGGPTESPWFQLFIPQLNALAVQTAIAGSGKGVRMFDVAAKSWSNYFTGADIADPFALLTFEYNTCTGMLYMSDYVNVVVADPDTLAQVSVTAAATSDGMGFVDFQNLVWIRLDNQFISA